MHDYLVRKSFAISIGGQQKYGRMIISKEMKYIIVTDELNDLKMLANDRHPQIKKLTINDST